MVLGFKVAFGNNRSRASSTSFWRAARYSFILSAQVTLGDRHTPPNSECQACDFQSRRSLPALVFVRVDMTLNPPDRLGGIAFLDDILPAKLFFHVQLENRVKDVVGRKRVLIGLVQFQLSAWGFDDLGDGNYLPVPSHPVGYPINHRFRYVADHRQAAAHIPVDGAVPH